MNAVQREQIITKRSISQKDPNFSWNVQWVRFVISGQTEHTLPEEVQTLTATRFWRNEPNFHQAKSDSENVWTI